MSTLLAAEVRGGRPASPDHIQRVRADRSGHLNRGSRRLCIVSAACTALLGSLLSACTSPTDGPPICKAGQLTATVHGDRHDNTSIYRTVTVRDQGRACRLPEQSAVVMTGGGQRLGLPGSYDPYGAGGTDSTGQQQASRVIVLSSQGEASMSVIMALAGSTRCDRDLVDALQVRLRGSAAITAAMTPSDRSHSPVCDTGSSSVLSYGRWVPGQAA